MFDNPVYLEPTFTLNGIPIWAVGCQAVIMQRKAEGGKLETGALRNNPQLVNIQIELSERDLI